MSSLPTKLRYQFRNPEYRLALLAAATTATATTSTETVASTTRGA
jgi:hypothetical protein